MIIGRFPTNSDFLALLDPDQAALHIRNSLPAQIGTPHAHATSVIGLTVRRSWRSTVTQ
ncbi:hypothetical protein DR64_1221 [Paraburkholderia xenovorans LB400]|uniref:hypothetical protein n=1 Tax=Paraburkholderia xenovorans TaxID=36873 RepID=UPI000037E5BF|nr:hypothetical protein [Paraburkholderia xenovorans]AIP30757.1 hypothetical protein DR64_1221 [Paraburkholderia xenovorans LB400]